ncbi:hypothetical protein [Candidatus Bartonella washoeensis]|uniref:Uncharacterized protein n=1 Tax=Cardidatus Bartonella washoeensis 085-0475 TaxID=1094564 RepID=J0QKB8_9HYPH|nr:hypothetical protein [Bartonella washoeensis]EJF86036.1 hypothetical protein MCW_00545 [Bartonella washoeensis 085-0475]
MNISSSFLSTAHSAGKVGQSIRSHIGKVGRTIGGGTAAIAFAHLKQEDLSVVGGILGADAAGGYIGSVINGAAGYIIGAEVGLAYINYQCIKK